LMEVEQELKKYNIPFFMLLGKPSIEILKFVEDRKASNLITDFDPLKIKRKWKNNK